MRFHFNIQTDIVAFFAVNTKAKKMKTRSFLTLTMLFLMNVAIGQQDLDATIKKSDAGEFTSLGSASIEVKGGKAPYYILWSSGSTAKKVDNLKPGAYVVRISDSKGTTIEKKIIIENRTITAQSSTNP